MNKKLYTCLQLLIYVCHAGNLEISLCIERVNDGPLILAAKLVELTSAVYAQPALACSINVVRFERGPTVDGISRPVSVVQWGLLILA